MLTIPSSRTTQPLPDLPLPEPHTQAARKLLHLNCFENETRTLTPSAHSLPNLPLSGILAGGHILAAGMCPPGLQVPVARQPPASRLSWRARCSVSMVVDSVESTLTRVPRGLCCQSRKAACPKAPHTVRKGARTSLGRAVRTRTVAPQVESTPNPSSFLLRLDAALATEGVESIFACGTMLTVSKVTAAS